MKDKVWYTKLWQDKLLELPAKEDADASWQKMQGLLDKNLPVNTPAHIRKPWRFGGTHLLTAAKILVASAVLYYGGTKLFKATQHKKTSKDTTQQARPEADTGNNIPYPVKTERDTDTTISKSGTRQQPLAADSIHTKADNNTANPAKNNNPGNAAQSSNTVNNQQTQLTPQQNAAGKKLINPKTSNPLKPANAVPANPQVPSIHQKYAGVSKTTNTLQINKSVNPIHTGIANSHLQLTKPNSQGKSAAVNKVSNYQQTANTLNSASRNNLALHQNKQYTTGNNSNNNYSTTVQHIAGVDINTPGKTNSRVKDKAGQAPTKNDSLSKQLLASAVMDKNNNLTDAPAAQKTGQTVAVTGNIKNGQSSKTPIIIKNRTPRNTTKVRLTKPKKSNYFAKNKSSQFELDVKISANSNGSFTAKDQNSNFYGKSGIDVFFGLAGAYHINKKIAIGFGINVLSPKVISGNYTNSNYQYITLDDTGKRIVHNTGKITISGTKKIYTVDIPVIASYAIDNYISIHAGPVISIPVKQNTIKTTLSPLSNTADTTVVPKVAPYVSSTAIDNKMSLSFTGGVRVNINRFFIDADYMRSASAYKISSALGSGKIYYQTVQFGIGYKLFKPKGR